MFKTHAHSLSCLSISHNGNVLCGVGKDTHNKNVSAYSEKLCSSQSVMFYAGHCLSINLNNKSVFVHATFLPKFITVKDLA